MMGNIPLYKSAITRTGPARALRAAKPPGADVYKMWNGQCTSIFFSGNFIARRAIVFARYSLRTRKWCVNRVCVCLCPSVDVDRLLKSWVFDLFVMHIWGAKSRKLVQVVRKRKPELSTIRVLSRLHPNSKTIRGWDLIWTCGELWENLEAKSLRVWQTTFFTNL